MAAGRCEQSFSAIEQSLAIMDIDGALPAVFLGRNSVISRSIICMALLTLAIAALCYVTDESEVEPPQQSLPEELVLSFRQVKCKTVEDVEHIVENAAACPRAVMYLSVDWSPLTIIELPTYADLVVAFGERHSATPVAFHLVDCTPITRGYAPLRELAGWRELEAAAGGSLIHGSGEVVWMRNGRVLHVEPIFNFESTEELVALTERLLFD
jgi:hypothetical protein